MFIHACATRGLRTCVCICVWNRREQIWSYIPAHCAEH